MTTDEKYIVFKREEWTAFITQRDPGGDPSIAYDEDVPDSLEDAVVIRKQDIFAGPALHAYASSIQTVIELLETLAPDPELTMHDIPGLTVEQVARLHEVRDYFFAQAMEADEVRGKKVPD